MADIICGVSLFSGLRYVLILAATAVLFGAFLMFWEAILMLLEGFRLARLDPDLSVIVAVLRATDKILLGIVLMVVGCGIALGFALDIPPEQVAAEALRLADERGGPWWRTPAGTRDAQ